MQAILDEPCPPPESSADDIELSVVMPCLNESRTVGRCVDKALTALQTLGVKGFAQKPLIFRDFLCKWRFCTKSRWDFTILKYAF